MQLLIAYEFLQLISPCVFYVDPHVLSFSYLLIALPGQIYVEVKMFKIPRSVPELMFVTIYWYLPQPLNFGFFYVSVW